MGRMFSPGVIQGFKVVPSSPSAMSVKVEPGSALISNGTSPGNYAIPVAHDTAAGEPVTIEPVSSSNRVDTIVAYVDMSMYGSTDTVNNLGALKFLAVKGTPNTAPIAPNAATIQAAVGAANPYTVIADVSTTPSTGQVTDTNITDRRTFAKLGLRNNGLFNYQTSDNNNIANVLNAPVRMQMGWGQIKGVSSSTTATKSVVFPTEFTTTLGVNISIIGYTDSNSTPATSINGFTNGAWDATATTPVISSTGFTASLVGAANLNPSRYYGFIWIAWGI